MPSVLHLRCICAQILIKCSVSIEVQEENNTRVIKKHLLSLQSFSGNTNNSADTTSCLPRPETNTQMVLLASNKPRLIGCNLFLHLTRSTKPGQNQNLMEYLIRQLRYDLY